MNQHASESNERLARATLRHDIGIPRELPTFAHAHDRKGLRWIWNSHHLGKQRRRGFVGAVQGGVRCQNSISDLVRVSPQICCDVSYVVVLHGRTFLSRRSACSWPHNLHTWLSSNSLQGVSQMFDQLMKRSNWVCVYKMGRFAEERRAFLCDMNKQGHSLRTLRNVNKLLLAIAERLRSVHRRI